MYIDLYVIWRMGMQVGRFLFESLGLAITPLVRTWSLIHILALADIRNLRLL